MTVRYDFVIVGAGSAGCVLAARLTEDPGVKVLLLEAGGPDLDAAVQMPVAFPTLFKSHLDWGFQTVPQSYAGGRGVHWPRGKVLGGSSSINAMIYIRGNPYDFDTWRDAYGCKGWGYADVLPYFLRAEDQQRGPSEFHGVGGPLRVEDLRYKSPSVQAWVDAARATGLPANRDFNGVSQDGVGFYQVTQRRGRRWSTADAYLRPALTRGNLTVLTGALATSLAVEGGRVTGVRYLLHGIRHVAMAGEVILSAGAIGSPHLLLLSGIGPADELRRQGVEVVLDAPRVGQGLQDHPNLAVSWRVPAKKAIWEGFSRTNAVLWQALGRGPIASNTAEAGGFVHTRPGLPAPDLQYHVVASPFVNQGLTEPTTRELTVLITPLAVGSRGAVTLHSRDPRHRPAIDPGYLSDPADLDLFLYGIRQCRQIALHDPLAGLVDGDNLPDGALEEVEFVRAGLATAYHPTSTLAMGSADAPVDPELRLRGIDGVRVVDASVIPEVPRGNTNAPTIMIAEHAADLITGSR